MKTRTLFVDADPVVYRAGFAAESNHYDIVAEDKDGKLHHATFKPTGEGKKHKTAWANAQKWMEKGKLELVDKQITVLPGPVDHALQVVRTQVESIVAAAVKQWNLESANDLNIVPLLSGPGNFREQLATLRPYKGNRDASHKPHHYQAIRDYLTGSWGAAVVHGREADDELSIRAWELRRDGRAGSYAIATIDKDLDQVPGLHYDYMKHVWTDQDEESAELWFWQQLVQGDRTDNIGGVCGFAEKGAFDWVMDNFLALERAEHPDWRAEMWARVVNLYNKQIGYRKCYYAASTLKASDIALENARLVYMQREAGELWVPPGEPEQFLKEQLDE